VIDRRVASVAFIVVGFAAGWFLQARWQHVLMRPDLGAAGKGTELPPEGQLVKPLEARTTKEVFERIYKNATWGKNADDVGNSGTGSTMRATRYWRSFLTEFLANNHVTSVVDAGCGDWEFSQSIDWTGIDYKGYDIVEAVVEADKKKFERPNVHFFTADIVEADLPSADLLVLKHVLQHLPNESVKRLMRQFAKYRHVLLVNGVDLATLSSDNPDIVAGGYRDLDLTAPPFSLHGAKVLTYWDGFSMQQVVHTAGHP
jgi:SAM-dependent methyltransferase